MSPSTGNILDLLLGGAKPSKAGGIAVNAATQPSGLTPFDELLGLVSMNPTAVAGMTGQVQSEKTNPLALLGSTTGDGNQSESDNSLTVSPDAMTGAALLSGITQLLSTGATINSDTAVGQDQTGTARLATGMVGSDKTSDKSTDASMLLPKDAVVTSPNVLNLLNQTAVDLPSGSFAVLSSKVTDGVLQMEVSPKESPNQTLKISLPVSLLHQQKTSGVTANALGMANARVPLVEPTASTTPFSQLLANAKVTEMEISVTPAKTAEAPQTLPVAVTLTAESGGKPLTLTAKTTQSKILATTTRPANDATVAVQPNGNSSSKSSLNDGSDSKSAEKKSTGPVAVAVDEKSDPDGFEALTRSIDNKNQHITDAKHSAILNGNGKELKATRTVETTTVHGPSVRMTIQRELPSLSRMEGRTLSIKLEPEYLGTARLHLTMHDDTLSARLMVDSTQAKTAVESSLNQLTDQLTKAGIRVDHIDVGVRGGGADNQSLNGQTNWFRSQQPQMHRIADLETTMPEVTMLSTPSREFGYVGSDRVNIYA